MLPGYIASLWVSVPPGDRGGIFIPGAMLLVELTV